MDSRQLYKEMDLGTAKPTAEQQARVSHHLLDLRSPDQPITLQEFQAEANPCINRERSSVAWPCWWAEVACISRPSPVAFSLRPCRPNRSCVSS